MRICLRFAALLTVLFAPALLGAQTTYQVPSALYPTIQSAINAASSGDTVQVTDSSVYHEHLNFGTKFITLTALTVGGPTLNGDGAGPVVTMSGVSTTTTGYSSLIGFNIINAGVPQTAGALRGAVNLSGGTAIIQNNNFTGNYCAAIVTNNANPQISNNTITGTLKTGCPASEGLGSAIVIAGNAGDTTSFIASIQGNTITKNVNSVGYSTDTGGGGAINITGATQVFIDSNVIADNVSTGYGGAVYIATTPSIYFNQNVVYGNKGVSGGLDIVIPGSTVGPVAGVINSNTIGYNTATTANAGSDIYIGGNLAQYQMVNNIIYGTTAGQTAVNCGTTYSNQTLTPLVMDHNDFFSINGNIPVGGACTVPTGINGNISVEPIFVNATTATVAAGTANFQLTTGSPAIDAGNNSAIGYDELDILRNNRFFDATKKGYPVIDMGAYEYGSCLPSSSCVLDMATHLVLTPNVYTPSLGSAVTLTGTFLIPWPTKGTVTFMEDGTVVGTGTITSVGTLNPTVTATITVSNLTQGLHVFVASTPGGSVYAPATAPATSIPVYLLVNGSNVATQTTLTSSVSSPAIGQSVTLTAAVIALTGTAIPIGSVYFIDGSNTLGSAPVDATGHASLPTTFTTGGGHSLVAAFVPSGLFAGSTGTLSLTVLGVASQSTLTLTPQPTVAGQPVTLKAVVGPAVSGITTAVPTGTMLFYVDGATVGTTTLVNGIGTLTLASAASGAHNYTCFYDGDSTFNASQCNQVSSTSTGGPTAIALSSSANPTYALTPFTVTATATPAASNFPVTLSVAGGSTTTSATATTNTAGVVTFNESLATGVYTLTASNSTITTKPSLTQTIKANPTSTTLLVTPNPANLGQTVTFAVSVLDTTGAQSPNGTVTVFDTNGTPVASVSTPASSAASTLTSVVLTTTSLVVGTHNLSASFTPSDGNFLASTTAATSSVTIGIPSITLTANPAAISIQTQHHAGLTLTAGSVLGFNGNVQLACATPLPAYLSCEFAQANINVASNGNASTTLTLETDAIPGFESVAPLSFNTPQGSWLSVGALAALALLAFAGRKRRSLRVLAVAILALTLSAAVSGCSGKYPGHTPPGTYTVTVNAIGDIGTSPQAPQASANITLTVTP